MLRCLFYRAQRPESNCRVRPRRRSHPADVETAPERAVKGRAGVRKTLNVDSHGARGSALPLTEALLLLNANLTVAQATITGPCVPASSHERLATIRTLERSESKANLEAISSRRRALLQPCRRSQSRSRFQNRRAESGKWWRRIGRDGRNTRGPWQLTCRIRRVLPNPHADHPELVFSMAAARLICMDGFENTFAPL